MEHKLAQYQITAPESLLEATIPLPASKSISNRAHIIRALTKDPQPVLNLSDCDDTRVMEEVFRSAGTEFDIGHAGTAMRFLTAWLSTRPGEWVLTGSERMKQRPIRVLVDALTSLGARISYLDKVGFPPLGISGSTLKGGVVELDGSVSSQYITALLLIAPSLEGGLILRLKNKLTSRSYIEMTLKLMEHFGIRHSWKNREISVPQQTYRSVEYRVEADWSAASYWYEILSLVPSGSIFLRGLTRSGLQGDEAVSHWFTGFGIDTILSDEGIRLTRNEEIQPVRIFLSFHENPDLAQTMAVVCVARKIPFHFIGLETLKIKETNRIAALQNELKKFGAILTEPSEGELKWDGVIHREFIQNVPVIETYNDHRMAMAFAPLALAGKPVIIQQPAVVTKSYPDFWDDLGMAGFSISSVPC
ncbi:MAG TPA: 3-phosphoshikimate 1-carboxyvinyltransferase [Prolixibacteraceae bacterium]|nr:3-phosphoshikimate 1-carboxyvinyltransferase [Prolixibacteraceae bacterium]